MSTNEAAVPVATPAAPAAVEVAAPIVPEAPATETVSAPKNAAEARQHFRDRATGRTPAKVDARGRGHAPDGKFTEGSFPAASTEPVAEAQAATPSASPSESVAVTETPTTHRIEIPEGHPLRDRGRQYADELTPDELRGLINQPIKQRELETARSQYQQAQQELQRAQAVIDELKSQRSKALSDPAFAANYNALLEADPAVAELYRKGYEADLEAAIGNRTQEADGKFQEQVAIQQAQQFTASVAQSAESMGVASWWLQQNLATELAAFGWRVERGLETDASPERALQYVKAAYVQHPHVAAHLSQQSQARRDAEAAALRQQAETAAAEATRKQLEQAATTNRSTNPLGRLQGATGQTVPVQTGIQSAAEARQRIKARSRLGRVG